MKKMEYRNGMNTNAKGQRLGYDFKSRKINELLHKNGKSDDAAVTGRAWKVK